jgi:hypothetical protein
VNRSINDRVNDRMNNSFPDHTADHVADRTHDHTHDRTHGRTQPEPVRWWIPLVASTGALLVLVLGTAAVVSGVVNSTLANLG